MPYDNTNSGVLFVKNKKNEKQPDYEGKLDVNGKEWALAGWKRTSKAGKPFLSIKVSEPRIEENGKPVQQEEVDF
jgi:uncharacterized protein (DUF736 family)